MIKRFDDDKISIVMRSRINRRRLKTNETVSDFYNELRKESQKINPTDKELKYFFMRALPIELQTQIIVQNPETPDEALNISKTLEQIDGISKCGENSNIGLEALRERKVSAAQNRATTNQDEDR